MKKFEPNDLETTQQPSGLGIALGVLCCGLCLLAFPHTVDMVNWLSWVFSGVGLLALLFGVFGTCSLLFN